MCESARCSAIFIRSGVSPPNATLYRPEGMHHSIKGGRSILAVFERFFRLVYGRFIFNERFSLQSNKTFSEILSI